VAQHTWLVDTKGATCKPTKEANLPAFFSSSKDIGNMSVAPIFFNKKIKVQSSWW